MRGVFYTISIFFLTRLLFDCSKKAANDTKSESSQNVVIVNIGEQNRAEIAQTLLKINEKDPSVIGLDVLFFSLKDSLQDSKLKNALGIVKPKLVSAFKYFALDEGKITESRLSNSYFELTENNNAFISKYVSGRRNSINKFFAKLELDGEDVFHFSVAVVSRFNIKLSDSFVDNVGSALINAKINFPQEYFPIYNQSELDQIESFKDKIVLVGFTGPGSEDKKYTPLNDNNYTEPDMYGVIILANIIEEILTDYNGK